jgi:hypothetical protein
MPPLLQVGKISQMRVSSLDTSRLFQHIHHPFHQHRAESFGKAYKSKVPTAAVLKGSMTFKHNTLGSPDWINLDSNMLSGTLEIC